MRTKAASFALFAFLLLPSPARAGWSESGFVADDYMGSRGARYVRAERTPDGDLFFSIIGQGLTFACETQRVLGSGSIAPGWPVAGIPFDNIPLGMYRNQAVVPDGNGGAFHAGTFTTPEPDSVGLQYVRPDGVIEPPQVGSTPKYWRLSRAQSSSHVDAMLDGGGGVYVAWTYTTLRLQRHAADGSVSPGWSPFGRFVAGASSGCPDIEPDGSGGVLLLWVYPNPRVIRILPDTTTAPGWPAGGLLLGSGSPDYTGFASPDLPKLVPSGPDHWIAVWVEFSGSDRRIVAQRFGVDGTLDPAWPVAGLEVIPFGPGMSAATTISDGEGGAHVLWDSNGQPGWSRVLANGTFALWGASPLDAGATYAGSGYTSQIAVPRPGGGLIFLWNDVRASGMGIRARWLLPNGSPDPSEPSEGRLIPLATTDGVKAAVADGKGGVYVAWQSWVSQFYSQLFVGRLLPSSLVDAPSAPGPSARFDLRAPGPNPAHDAFEVRYVLPDHAPARLELFDVSGRMLRAQDVRGAGEGSARFDRLGELRAGVYVVRLSRGRDVRTARVVIAP